MNEKQKNFFIGLVTPPYRIQILGVKMSFFDEFFRRERDVIDSYSTPERFWAQSGAQRRVGLT